MVVLQTGYGIYNILPSVPKTVSEHFAILDRVWEYQNESMNQRTHKRAIIITCPSPQAPLSPANTHVYTHTHTRAHKQASVRALALIQTLQNWKLSGNESKMQTT